MGCKSSDIYYINEDRKVAFKKSLLSNAGKMAAELRRKHLIEMSEKQKKMHSEAEERIKLKEEIERKDAEEKEKKEAKKLALKKI